MLGKKYKIKRYRQYGGGSSFRAGPHPLSVALWVLAAAGLVVVGILIYEPVYNFLTADHSAGEVSLPEPETELSSMSSEREPEPEPEPEPDIISDMRAAYLPAAAIADAAALEAFFSSLEGSEVNTVMVDIKDASGNVLFASENPDALSWGAVIENPFNLRELAADLEQRGFALAVRMSAFRDPIAARGGRENAILYRDTEMLWLDEAEANGGRPWLNPYSKGARDYLGALATEAAGMGARMVVLDNVQFPPYSETNASFGSDTAGITRTQALSRFVDELTALMLELEVRTGVYYTAISLTQENENLTRYGGSPINVSCENLILGALPYQFGGGYDAGGLTVAQPVQNPGGAVEAALAYVSESYRAAGKAPPVILPLVQGGSEPDINSAAPYTKVQVDAQIGAVKAAGLSEYLLYSTTGVYPLQ